MTKPISIILDLILIFSGFLAQLRVLSLRYDFPHDFGYAKLLQEASNLPPELVYDYIVVGGGTTGIPIATTLSSKYSVLILERGNSPHVKPNSLHLNGWIKNLQQSEEDDTPAQKFVSKDGVEFVRGRILGGGTSINLGFYSRAEPEFYSTASIVDWNMEKVEEAYEWVEETIVSHPDLKPFHAALFEAMLQSNIHPNNGFTLNHPIGSKVSGSTYDKSGRKHSAVELLNKANPENILVALHATVERIIFSTSSTSKLSAVGVIFRDGTGQTHKATIREHGEVILSAGALGSPQLLLLSGVGPSSYLSSIGINVIHNQPNVGRFVADPGRNGLGILPPFPLPIDENIQTAGIAYDYYIEAVSFKIPFRPEPKPHSFFPVKTTDQSTLNLDVSVIVGKLARPLSSGTLRLASPTDVRVQPIVEYNYYTHPDDLANCTRGVRKMAEMLNSPAMEKFKFTDIQGKRGFMYAGPSLPEDLSDDVAIENFCRETVATFWHYHGGCTLGKVVDGNFRVFGINALRVLDISVMPFAPGTNPQATLMMTGRYMGVKMLKERSNMDKDDEL